MNRLLLFFSLPLLGLSQTAVTTTPTPNGITTVVRVQNVAAEKVASMLVVNGGVNIRSDNSLGVIVLHGDPSTLNEIHTQIQELDRRSSNDVEVTAYVIGATNQSSASTPVGKEIEPVVKQLAAVFPYAAYAILDTVLLRSTVGSDVQSNGVLRLPGADSTSAQYFIGYRVESRPGNSRALIALTSFRFRAVLPNGGGESSLTTNLDIQPGQKIVVGKTNANNGEAALFVVLTARFLD